MSTDNLTEKNNKLFRLYTAKLHEGNPYTFTTFADKLRTWLSSQRAYYADARPQIVNLLLTAQVTLRRAVRIDTNFSVPFNACDHLDHPIAPAYIRLIQAVEPYRSLFVEPHLQSHIKFLLPENAANGSVVLVSFHFCSADVPQAVQPVIIQSIPQPLQSTQPPPAESAGFMKAHEARNTMNPQSSSLISALGVATLSSEIPPAPQPPVVPVSKPVARPRGRKGRGYLNKFHELDDDKSIVTAAPSSSNVAPQPTASRLVVVKQEVTETNLVTDAVPQGTQALPADPSGGGYVKQFLNLDRDNDEGTRLATLPALMSGTRLVPGPEAPNKAAERDEDEDALQISQELQTLDPDAVESTRATDDIPSADPPPSLPPSGPPRQPMNEEPVKPVSQELKPPVSNILESTPDASSAEPSPYLAPLAPVSDWSPLVIETDKPLEGPIVNETISHLETEPGLSNLESQVEDGIIHGEGLSRQGGHAPDVVESEVSTVILEPTAYQPSQIDDATSDAPKVLADEDTEMADGQGVIGGTSDHQELPPEVFVFDSVGNAPPPDVIPQPDAPALKEPTTENQPARDSEDDMDLDVPTPGESDPSRVKPQDDGGPVYSVDPQVQTMEHVPTPSHTDLPSEPINTRRVAVAPPVDLHNPVLHAADGMSSTPETNGAGLLPSTEHRMEDEAPGPVPKYADEPLVTDVVGSPQSPSPRLRVFGQEMTVSGIQPGCKTQSNIKFQFIFPEQQFVYLSGWNNRTKSDVSLNQCLCFSLGCYSATEFHANLRKDTKLEEHITFLRSAWPQTGGLDLGVTFHDEPFYLPLSPPFGLTPDGLVDISQFVVRGQNKLELIQRRDMSGFVFALIVHQPTILQRKKIEERRLKDQQWQERLNYFARPFDISLMCPSLSASIHTNSQSSPSNMST
ncbi:hypothetical protein BD779DRAFT_1501041 [Infundibulicybe gibba]|nr:hypothetical protein BD779DRAFT_1501041 [Infundibulicybe gibba]